MKEGLVFTFEQLPKAVGQLFIELEDIKRLLLSQTTRPETDELLTIKEASLHLKLAVPTVYTLVSQGILPHFKQQKRLYFSKQDLTSWIKSGRKQTVSEIQAAAVNGVATKNKKG